MAHLVFQTAFPGDLFLAIPLLKRLKEWEPEAELVLACRQGIGDFFINSGLVDEVVEIDKRSGAGRRRSLKRITGREWDVVIVPHESVRTALWMFRVRARRAKISFRQWWNFPFFTHRVVKPETLPDALRQLSLLTAVDTNLAERFGGDDVSALINPTTESSPVDFRTTPIPDWASMQVGNQDTNRTSDAKNHVQSNTIYMAPGSVWNTKRWTVQGFEGLALLLLQRGYRVELVGSAAERKICAEIARKVPGVFDRSGATTLNGLAELFREGRALVTNDSGAMHIAATVGLPTVAVFGPTVLDFGFRPWQTQALVVQRELECRPCGKHGGNECPIGTHECMEKITPSDVYAALNKLLEHP